MSDADKAKRTPGDPVEEGEPVYYARGGKVWKSPVRRRKEGGSSIQLGFPVCTMTEAAGEENAAVVAELMNRGDVADDLLEALKALDAAGALKDYIGDNKAEGPAKIKARAAIAKAETA